MNGKSLAIRFSFQPDGGEMKGGRLVVLFERVANLILINRNMLFRERV
jgi:hypothetical protein